MICDMFALSLSSCGMCMPGISLDNSLEKYGNKMEEQIINNYFIICHQQLQFFDI